MTHNPSKAVLVYQAGIANVFSVESFNMNPFGRNARRLLQSDFRSCENFARGMAAAGVKVASAFCNMAGDIVDQPWNTHLDTAPFSDKFRPVWQGVAA
jgi:hypothetical protein